MPFIPEKRVEIPDPRPVALPIGFEAPEPLPVLVQRLVKTHVSQAAALEGHETFEEANNFDTGEDGEDPLSPAEQAAELGDLLEASKTEIAEAEAQVRAEMARLEKTRKKLKAEREKREAEKIEEDE